jgi:hypothetical protein
MEPPHVSIWLNILLWSIGITAPLGAAFGILIILSRVFRLSAAIRLTGTTALWLVSATLICWLLFEQADAQAAAIHRQNIGMAIVYFYFWLLAVLPAPVVGVVLSRFITWRRD